MGGDRGCSEARARTAAYMATHHFTVHSHEQSQLSGVVGLTVLQPKFLEQFHDVRFHFKNNNLAQRGTFKGAWLNERERETYTLERDRTDGTNGPGPASQAITCTLAQTDAYARMSPSLLVPSSPHPRASIIVQKAPEGGTRLRANALQRSVGKSRRIGYGGPRHRRW
jgi:hypothetical protein